METYLPSAETNWPISGRLDRLCLVGRRGGTEHHDYRCDSGGAADHFGVHVIGTSDLLRRTGFSLLLGDVAHVGFVCAGAEWLARDGVPKIFQEAARTMLP